jgi:hypothetical protein
MLKKNHILFLTTILFLFIIIQPIYAEVSIDVFGPQQETNITLKPGQIFNITFSPTITTMSETADNVDIHLIKDNNTEITNFYANPSWLHTTDNETEDHYQRGSQIYNESTGQYEDGLGVVETEHNLTITYQVSNTPKSNKTELIGWFNWLNLIPFPTSDNLVPFGPNNDSINYIYYNININLSKPTIKEIQLYNITNKIDEKTNKDQQIHSGLNTTYEMRLNEKYRYDIIINTNSDWTISEHNIIQLAGLNENWTIEENNIWISNATTNWTGGSFQNGIVSYNTENGGFIKENQNLTFSFIINTTDKSPSMQGITTINNSGIYDQDYSTYLAAKPILLVELITPPDNTIIGQNKTLFLNASALCTESDCDTITAYARYNGTTINPEEYISTNENDIPLFTQTNPKTCSNIKENEYCNISFALTFTGDLHSEHKIDVLFTSNNAENNNTDYSTIKISIVLIIDLEFEEIYFGIQDPNTGIVPATQNAIGYNISVDPESNDIKNLWIKGTDLTHNNNILDSYGTIYKIPVNNVMWSLENNNPPNPTVYNLTKHYERVNKNMQTLPSGTSTSLFFWLDVIGGIAAGGYNGTLNIMANETW